MLPVCIMGPNANDRPGECRGALFLRICNCAYIPNCERDCAITYLRMSAKNALFKNCVGHEYIMGNSGGHDGCSDIPKMHLRVKTTRFRKERYVSPIYAIRAQEERIA